LRAAGLDCCQRYCWWLRIADRVTDELTVLVVLLLLDAHWVVVVLVLICPVLLVVLTT